FSCRRRHTRSTRACSSDVCSSDLSVGPAARPPGPADIKFLQLPSLHALANHVYYYQIQDAEAHISMSFAIFSDSACNLPRAQLEDRKSVESGKKGDHVGHGASV